MSEERKFKIISIPDEITLNKNNIYGFEIIPSDEFLTKEEYEGIPIRLVSLQKVEQLEKEVNEYQKELEKADSITQSCIFQGKQESKISFRKCLNRLEQLENIRKEAIEYIKKNLTIGSILDGKKTYCLNSYSFDYEDLLNILNKGE